MDTGGQICFLLLTSLQTSGIEALPADVQPASLILSQGILAELNTIRQSNYPLGSLAYFLPPSTSPLVLSLSLSLSRGSVSHSSTPGLSVLGSYLVVTVQRLASGHR